MQQQQDRAWREQERIHLFSVDPFDLEAQAKIEEDVRPQNIEENMTIAMEEGLESFCRVVVLYINCKVNGHPLKAFVDSGAQMTIMSQACAERCNIGLDKKCLRFLSKTRRQIFFIFTKDFIEQCIHPFVPLPSAIF